MGHDKGKSKGMHYFLLGVALWLLISVMGAGASHSGLTFHSFCSVAIHILIALLFLAILLLCLLVI